MGRHMGRDPRWAPPPELWDVHFAVGGFVVMDPRGQPVLSHPDPVEQLSRAKLMAAAPLLRHELAIVVRRMRCLVPEFSSQHLVDGKYLHYAEAAVIASHPTLYEIERATRHAERRLYELTRAAAMADVGTPAIEEDSEDDQAA